LCQHLSTFAATKLGAIAARRLRIPDTRAESLVLLAETKELYNLENRLTARFGFEGIQDIGESLDRSERQGILAGSELFAIATTLAGVRNLRRLIDDQPDCPTLMALVAELRTYPELEQTIYHCIDERGEVSDRASAKLAEIRVQLRRIREQIYEKLQRLVQKHASAVQDTLITQRGERFVIPLKATHKDAIPGIVHDTSMSGATLYVEPQSTVSLNNQLRQLQRQEDREAEAIRQALTEQVAAVKPDLERLLAIATTLDLATARARYSYWLRANPPHFLDLESVDANAASLKRTQTVTLRQLRHPLLVWQQQHEQGQSVIPIDVLINPSIRVVAITGPNTGGKTVTLKTLGLAVLMAKVGLFIPAREPVELPWFAQVLADIGDEQSIEQSLSTFSGHIRRIIRILAAIEAPEGPNTLVLLDEVGAGTDPTEGSALATALLQYLADHAQLTVASTHFGELKALKYQDDRFENASVEFDNLTLSPTYRLLWGIPGRSNALTIAQRLGLKADVIAQAQQQIGGISEDINQVIAGLESQRRQQELKAREAGQLLAQTEQLHQEIYEKAASLQERERQLQLVQEQAVQQAIAQAKQEIAHVIRQLQQGPQTAQEAQRATLTLNEIANRHLSARSPAPQPSFQPHPGDRVRIPRLSQTGEVLSAPNEAGELTIRFGLMKMTLTLADIESLDGQKPALPTAKAAKSVTIPKASSKSGHSNSSRRVEGTTDEEPEAPLTLRTSRNTLDVRGSRVADAEIELDRALSTTQEACLWVIHGHGTGRLRQGIHAFLQTHPRVRDYQLPEPAEGGSGVTIVHLK
jgi:DNA mismatch repair protein MutS2